MIQAERAFSSKVFAEQFLAVITSVMPLSSCCFYRVNGDRHVLDHQLVNLSPYWEQRYYHYFWRLDPLHPRRIAGSMSRVRVLSQETLGQDADALEYRERFLKPQNTAHQTELYFWHGSRIVAGASLLRSHSEGGFSEQNIAFLEKFVDFTEHNLLQECGGNDEPDWRSLADMTPREREIASLVGEAMSNKEICRRLNIELPTVKAHVSRVLAKAGARTRAEFIKKLQSR